MLAFNKAVSCNTAAATPTLLAVKRLLQTTTSTCKADATGTSAGSAGSKGAAPGRATGKDEDVKFGGDPDGSPSSEELYGRKDRDPMPSPNPGLTQATAAEMSFPRDQPLHHGDNGSQGTTGVTKEEGVKAPEAYPIQNDPSVPGGAGPDLSPEVAQELQQDESSGPKAAGQGVVENLAKEDPESYGSGRSSPA